VPEPRARISEAWIRGLGSRFLGALGGRLLLRELRRIAERPAQGTVWRTFTRTLDGPSPLGLAADESYRAGTDSDRQT